MFAIRKQYAYGSQEPSIFVYKILDMTDTRNKSPHLAEAKKKEVEGWWNELGGKSSRRPVSYLVQIY